MLSELEQMGTVQGLGAGGLTHIYFPCICLNVKDHWQIGVGPADSGGDRLGPKAAFVPV